MTGRAFIVRGDARALPLPNASVDLVVTSPPYFALRSYTDGGQHYAGQIGSEPTPAEYIAALVDCTREMMRVLKPAGSIWVDLGDKYAEGQRRLTPRDDRAGVARQGVRRGAGFVATDERTTRPKSLMLLPERYRIACVDQLGLIARAVIIWSKPNGLPESVTDRVRRSHEDWVHLTKQARYYSAVDEIREPQSGTHPRRKDADLSPKNAAGLAGKVRNGYFGDTTFNPLGKLPGSVWTIPTEPLQMPAHLGVDHFAAFPTEFPRRIILGWSPSGICTVCGEGRRPVVGVDWSKVPHRMVEKRALTIDEVSDWCHRFADWCAENRISRTDLDSAAGTSDMGGWWASKLRHRAQVPTPGQWAKIRANFDPPTVFDDVVLLTQSLPVAARDVGTRVAETGKHRMTGGGLGVPVNSITGYVCACPQPTAPTRPSVILDPFGGTGTVALVAHALGRIGISVDRSADYNRIATWRTTNPGEIAKAMRVPKPEPVADAQLVLDLGGVA